MPAKKARKSHKPKVPAAGRRPSKAQQAQYAKVPPQLKGTKAASKVSPSASSAVRGITPFLWFDTEFEAAARFYVSLFPDSRIDGLTPMGGSFTLAGQRFMGLNGGPHYRFTPAVSFFVVCKDQKEVDRLWASLEKGGKPSQCGWIDDKFGLTWQIVPEAFLRMTSDPDPKKVQAVFGAMMGMVKMDVKGLQAAYDAA
ncbi:MAG TPA: VOC family protein [Candidatus Thermoplasmatota archaeon]|nr:VOC family protein [Candidatus Thermoplasmatota archaeon]